MNYTIEKIIDRVYNLSFDNEYDLSMLFLRYQEFYESPNPKFRNKQFTLLDYMEWWAKDHNGVFSYPRAWGGYNVPSSIIDSVRDTGIIDPSKYDEEMKFIHSLIKCQTNGEDYYLIGCTGEGSVDNGVLAHELAHGMYYTIPAYKRAMDILVNDLPDHIRDACFKWLGSIGYTKEVFVDETQAYFSGGFSDKFNLFAHKRACKPFIRVYQSFKESAIAGKK